MMESSTTPESSRELLILGADYATGNMGVDALLSGTVASAARVRPPLRVRLLGYGRSAAVHHVPVEEGTIPVDTVLLRFSWKPWLRNNAFRLLATAGVLRLLPAAARRRWIARHPVLSQIQQASLCASLAGGDSFSDIYGMRRLLYVCLPQLLALALGRPLVLLPQTIGPFRSRAAKFLARFIMTRARIIWSRDAEGLAVAEELTDGRANVRFSHDMAFALQPEVPPGGVPAWLGQRDGSRPLVGINVSGLLFRGGYDGGNGFGLACDYVRVLREFVAWLVEEQNAEVMLVSHVNGAGESDAAACLELRRQLPPAVAARVQVADPAFNHRQVKHVIGQCDFFVGARMHACIAALSQGVPAAGMAYSRKFVGVFESVGAASLVVDLRKLDDRAAQDDLRAAFMARERLAADLREKAKEARQSALGLFRRHLGDATDAAARPPAAGVPALQRS